jgi:ABC-type cobalt transport system substrate-binding protein
MVFSVVVAQHPPALSVARRVYRGSGDEPIFQKVCAPTSAELQDLLVKIITCIMSVLIVFASRLVDRSMAASKNGE